MCVVFEEKEIKRAYCKGKRGKMSREDKNEKNGLILSNFLSLKEYAKSDVILIYVSKSEEIDTRKIIDYALNSGKKVAVPKCNREDMWMEFYFINSCEQLVRGNFNVPEPNPQKCAKVLNLKSGICVVPGYCFDKAGHRLGYGKGFYDRFLARFKGTTVGLCYEENVENRLVTNEFDKKVKIIVTEEGVKYIDEEL